MHGPGAGTRKLTPAAILCRAKEPHFCVVLQHIGGRRAAAHLLVSSLSPARAHTHKTDELCVGMAAAATDRLADEIEKAPWRGPESASAREREYKCLCVRARECKSPHASMLCTCATKLDPPVLPVKRQRTSWQAGSQSGACSKSVATRKRNSTGLRL